MSDSSTVQVGIAGLGRSGWDIHGAVLAELSGQYRVAAATDNDPDRLFEAAEKFGCRTYSSYDDLLGDPGVELVVVATPNKLHAHHSIAAMKAGKHVVCEKPMATSVSEADSMIETARATGRMLAIFQNYRYRPDFVKVRETIGSGKLGRIVMVRIAVHSFKRRWDWQTLKECGGGDLRNNAPHSIDMALQLFGEKEPEVFCLMDRALTLGDAEDHVKLILHAPGCPTIDVEVTSACAYPQETWLVMGTSGTLAGGMNGLRWKYLDPATLPAREVEKAPTAGRAYCQEDLPWKEEECWKDPKPGGLYWRGFYEDLHRTLRNGASVPVTPESVRRQLVVIEKCLEMSTV